jgi:hypothetical protein
MGIFPTLSEFLRQALGSSLHARAADQRPPSTAARDAPRKCAGQGIRLERLYSHPALAGESLIGGSGQPSEPQSLHPTDEELLRRDIKGEDGTEGVELCGAAIVTGG